MEVFSFLEALPEDFITRVNSFEKESIGKSIQFYHEIEIENWSEFDIALVSVTEFESESCANPDFYIHIREDLFQLYKGNWKKNLLDLGNITSGNELSDTFYVLQEVQRELMRKNIILIILGGRQDLTYAQYRAYDHYKYMVNLVGIDAKFDIGDADQPISGKSYVSHMIVDKPYNLFNFSNLGYQTYYVKQEEKDLVENLYFEAYRLGEVSDSPSEMEPVLRDADLVSVDFESIKASEISVPNHRMVNGFTAKEFCIFSRYSGLSYKNTSFGIYHLEKFENLDSISQIAAQIIWYYIEGVNYRLQENPRLYTSLFTLYKVPINDDVLSFYESEKTGRWWIEIPHFASKQNKLSEVSLLPCSKEDYLNACDQTYPNRWYRAKCKNEV